MTAPSWHGENELINEVEADFGEVRLLDAVGLFMAAIVDPARCRVFMTSRDWIATRKLKDTQGHYLLQPDPTADGVFRLLGLPVTITNRIPTTVDDPATTTVNEGRVTSIVLADMSKIAVARDLAPSVKLLDQTVAAYDQQAIRVVAHYDTAPLLPEASWCCAASPAPEPMVSMLAVG